MVVRQAFGTAAAHHAFAVHQFESADNAVIACENLPHFAELCDCRILTGHRTGQSPSARGTNIWTQVDEQYWCVFDAFGLESKLMAIQNLQSPDCSLSAGEASLAHRYTAPLTELKKRC